ncbi:hypothetical protein ABIC83_002536 [Roseateles asaccharophilus]|uniref:hypothetical protein n=1 Tax=Roseateles asaccharophilus TaxID=582607 RepID=UPI0038356D56
MDRQATPHDDFATEMCEADLLHHIFVARVASTLPSPVVLVRMGVKNIDYLDEFPKESIHWPEIQAYKKDRESRRLAAQAEARSAILQAAGSSLGAVTSTA